MTSAGMMIDIDERAVFKAEQSSAGDAIALEQDGGNAVVGDVGCRGSMVNTLDIGQGAIDQGNGVSEDDIGLASELIENFGEGKNRAESIPIGPCMRGENKPGAGAKGF